MPVYSLSHDNQFLNFESWKDSKKRPFHGVLGLLDFRIFSYLLTDILVHVVDPNLLN